MAEEYRYPTVIHPDALYGFQHLRKEMGFGESLLARIKSEGGEIYYYGRGACITGATLIAHIKKHGRKEHPNASKPVGG
jgi:hypothetical protein